MANRISYKPSGIIMSSAITDFDVFTDGPYIDVTLTGMGGIVVLSERYYSYGGRVTLYDLGSLIEADMQKSGSTVSKYTLKVFTDSPSNNADSCELNVLYCDRFTVCQGLDTFLAENFLTTLSMRRVPPGSTASLFFYALQGEDVSYTVVCDFRKEGSDALYHHSFTLDSGKKASATGVVQLNFSLATLVASAAGFALARPSEIVPLSFTLSLGQRSVTFFVDPKLNDLDCFMFRNCFNVWDVAHVGGVTTAKTDVDRSTAVLNGFSRFYNQSTEKKYEVESDHLTSDEADWIDQLFTSHEVLRIVQDATSADEPLQFAPAMISQSTCEIQNGDEKLNKVKFTWRYTNNRPIVSLSASKGIFSTQYNIVYS